MGFMILGLVAAIALGSFAFGSSDDDVVDAPEAEDQEAGGSDLLTEAEEGDILSPDQETSAETDSQHGDLHEGGDAEPGANTAGTDAEQSPAGLVLEVTELGDTLVGGDGNDSLSGITATDIDGRAGDDTITFNGDVEYNSTTARIEGGDGDDTINVLAKVGDIAIDRGGAMITGGEGADSFNFVLDMQNSTLPEELLDGAIARITDFTPGEDTVTIQLERSPETMGREYDVGFEQVERDGSYETQLSITFKATEDANASTSTLMISSTQPFTMDDIELIDSAQAARV